MSSPFILDVYGSAVFYGSGATKIARLQQRTTLHSLLAQAPLKLIFQPGRGVQE